MTQIDFSENRIAILFFSLSPSRECEVKSISRSSRIDRLLWHKLGNRTEKILQKTGLPYFRSNESTQVGDSFGDKLSHAVENVFNKGYNKIIIVGNDCPGLRSDSIKKTAEKLESNSLAIGPDSHGGAYIIGLHKQNFKSEQFSNLPWQSDRLCEGLYELYSDLPYYVLRKLHDINLLHDVKLYVSSCLRDKELKQLLLVVLTMPTVLRWMVSFQSTWFRISHYNKGSPLMV